MITNIDTIVEHAVDSLRQALGGNLYSCCVYGSAVRGNMIVGLSDINLLIVLNESSPEAHKKVEAALRKYPKVDPFILGRRGFERSVRAFSPKFSSIQQHYRILHGADPLAGIKPDPKLEKFLCEQALRNLRLRMVFSFVTRHVNRDYNGFLMRNVTTVFVQLSEAARLQGLVLPDDFAMQIPVFEKEFNLDAGVLRDLLALKKSPHPFADTEQVTWHERLFPVVDGMLMWMETNWKD
jgi:predicted nucleotidyltransferase